MYLKKIYSLLYNQLPKYTDKFSEKFEIDTATFLAGVVTITTIDDHNLSNNEQVNIIDCKQKTPITNIEEDLDIDPTKATATTSIAHDLTMDYDDIDNQPPITIIDSNVEAFNNTFDLVTVDDRNHFTFADGFYSSFVTFYSNFNNVNIDFSRAGGVLTGELVGTNNTGTISDNTLFLINDDISHWRMNTANNLTWGTDGTKQKVQIEFDYKPHYTTTTGVRYLFSIRGINNNSEIDFIHVPTGQRAAITVYDSSSSVQINSSTNGIFGSLNLTEQTQYRFILQMTIDSAVAANTILRLIVEKSDGTKIFDETINVNLAFDYDPTQPTKFTLGGRSNVVSTGVSYAEYANLISYDEIIPQFESGNLLENSPNGFSGVKTITVTGDKTFTFETTSSLAPNGYGGYVHADVRVGGAVEPERIIRAYSKQLDDDYWAFIVPEGTAANKDRHVLNDSTATPKYGDDFRQKIINGFSIYIFIPSRNDMSGRKSYDAAVTESIALFKSLIGATIESPYTESNFSKIYFDNHGIFSFVEAHYIHKFTFGLMDIIESGDFVVDNNDVAFRDIEMYNLNDEDENIMETKIELDN